MKTYIFALLAITSSASSFAQSVTEVNHQLAKNVMARTVEVQPNCATRINSGCYRTSDEFIVEDEADYFVTVISRLQHSDITLSLDNSPIANNEGKILGYPIGKGKSLRSKIINVYARVSNINLRTDYSDIEVVIHTKRKSPYLSEQYSLGLRMDSGTEINKFYINLLTK